MDAYDIKTMIEEDVRCDIHGDLYGHDRVAEHLAAQFDALKEKIKLLEQKHSDAGWKEDQLRAEGYYDRGRDGWS